MIRPVDVLLEFLEAEKARGMTHVHLDEDAREELRQVFLKTKAGTATPSQAPPVVASLPASVPEIISLKEEPKPITTAELTLGSGSKEEQLAALRKQAEKWPPATSLGTLRDVMVFATGNPYARLMLIGEAPGLSGGARARTIRRPGRTKTQ